MTFTPRATDFVREDGLVERRAKWADLGVGMTLIREGRKWKIIDSAIPPQFQYGHSLWFRIQAPKGEVQALAPMPLTHACTILLDPTDDTELPPTLPQGHAEAVLLIEKLGATEIATKDNATGEIWCPNYAAGDNHLGEIGDGALRRGELEHLRIAHGMDTGALEALPALEQIKAISKAHGPLHFKLAESLDNGRGFPHRHMPEDLSIM